MQSVAFLYCYAECQYAECHYTESRYAECRGAQTVESVSTVKTVKLWLTHKVYQRISKS